MRSSSPETSLSAPSLYPHLVLQHLDTTAMQFKRLTAFILLCLAAIVSASPAPQIPGNGSSTHNGGHDVQKARDISDSVRASKGTGHGGPHRRASKYGGHDTQGHGNHVRESETHGGDEREFPNSQRAVTHRRSQGQREPSGQGNSGGQETNGSHDPNKRSSAHEKNLSGHGGQGQNGPHRRSDDQKPGKHTNGAREDSQKPDGRGNGRGPHRRSTDNVDPSGQGGPDAHTGIGHSSHVGGTSSHSAREARSTGKPENPDKPHVNEAREDSQKQNGGGKGSGGGRPQRRSTGNVDPSGHGGSNGHGISSHSGREPRSTDKPEHPGKPHINETREDPPKSTGGGKGPEGGRPQRRSTDNVDTSGPHTHTGTARGSPVGGTSLVHHSHSAPEARSTGEHRHSESGRAD